MQKFLILLTNFNIEFHTIILILSINIERKKRKRINRIVFPRNTQEEFSQNHLLIYDLYKESKIHSWQWTIYAANAEDAIQLMTELLTLIREKASRSSKAPIITNGEEYP